MTRPIDFWVRPSSFSTSLTSSKISMSKARATPPASTPAASSIILSHGMGSQEIADEGDNPAAGIFQHIVAGVGKGMNFGRREAALPFLEEMPVKHKILLAPADER